MSVTVWFHDYRGDEPVRLMKRIKRKQGMTLVDILELALGSDLTGRILAELASASFPRDVNVSHSPLNTDRPIAIFDVDALQTIAKNGDSLNIFYHDHASRQIAQDLREVINETVEWAKLQQQLHPPFPEDTLLEHFKTSSIRTVYRLSDGTTRYNHVLGFLYGFLQRAVDDGAHHMVIEPLHFYSYDGGREVNRYEFSQTPLSAEGGLCTEFRAILQYDSVVRNHLRILSDTDTRIEVELVNTPE